MRNGKLKTLWAIAALLIPSLVSSVTMASNDTDKDGWTLITQQDPTASLVHIRIVVRSGSLSDLNEPGLAYFTARAVLRGTKTRPYQELNNSIETLGATISATVDPTKTVFTATVLNQNLDSFLDLLRDVLTNPAFAVTEMNLLQKILYGELRSDLQESRNVAARALMQLAYVGLPLQNPVHGTVDSVSKITPQDATGFFKAHYSRENMVIAVTSPLTPADLTAKLQMKLDSVPHGTLDAQKQPASVIKGRQVVIVDQKGLSTVPIFMATAGASDADPDLFSLEAGNFIFGADFTSRLMQVLRAENGWTYGAYSGFGQLLSPQAEAGLFSIYLYPSAEHFGDAVAKALSMFEDYAHSGLTADELAFAKESLTNRYPFQLDSAEKRLDQTLRSSLTGRPLLTVDQYAAQVAALDLTKLNAAIAVRTDVQDIAIAVVGDAATLKPVLAALPGVKSVTVVQIDP